MRDASQDAVLVAALERARELGYLGPGPVLDHLVHAMAFARAVEAELGGSELGGGGVGDRRVADLGSGGGVPGLVLARRWPAARFWFLDANQRRMATLTDAIGELELEARATVVCGRAEELARQPTLRGAFDVVVARGFAEPAVTAECAAPLLRPGGLLVVSDPPDDRDRWPAAGLAMLGLAGSRTVRDGVALFVGRLVGDVADRYPRRTGVPGKRPLF